MPKMKIRSDQEIPLLLLTDHRPMSTVRHYCSMFHFRSILMENHGKMIPMGKSAPPLHQTQIAYFVDDSQLQ